MTRRSLNRRVADLVLMSDDRVHLAGGDQCPASISTSPATAAGGWSTFLSLAGGRKLAIPARSSQWHASTSRSVPVRPSTRWLSSGVAARCDPGGSRAEHNAPHEDPHGAYGGVGNGGHHAIRAGTTA